MQPESNGIDDLRVNVRGAPARYLMSGQGKPVFLLHSVSGTSDGWRRFLQLLRARDTFSYFAPDFPGFGGGDFPSEGFSTGWYVDFLFDLVKSIDKSGQTICLVGDSLGGILSLKFTLKHPELVEKLVLLETPYYFPHRLLRLIARPSINCMEENERFQHLISLGIQNDVLVGFIWKLLWSIDPSQSQLRLQDEIGRLRRLKVLDIARVTEEIIDTDLRGRLTSLDTNTLIISGTLDYWVPPHLSRELQGELRNSRLTLLSGVKHGVLFNEPGLVVASVEEFLTGG